jgi:multidrug efflux system membrane fusion protein
MLSQAQLGIGLKSKCSSRTSSHKHRQHRWLGLTVALLIGCVAAACSRSDAVRVESVRPEKPTYAEAENAPEVRIFSGRLAPSKQVELAFPVAGVLVNVPIREGNKVAKGQIIAQLRLAEFQARLESVQGQLDQARAALNALRLVEKPEEQLQRQMQERVSAMILEHARKEFDRYARLVRLDAVSRSEYELAETNFLVAQEEHNTAMQLLETGRTTRKEDVEAQEGLVRGLSGQVAEAELELEDSTLRAPFDGVVAQRFIDEGQSVTVNKPVIRFQSIEAIDIVVDAPDTVKTSDICSPSIVGMVAEISTVPGRQYPVHIKEVVPVADPITQAFQVRFEMKPPFGVTVVPGMTASVSVKYETSLGSDGTPMPISSPCIPDPRQR